MTVCMVASPASAEPVAIFAAASLKTALDKIIEVKALDAVAVYGGSAGIARQIFQGARADIVILAHPEWMDWLEQQGALNSNMRCNVIGNSLVLAGSQDAPDLVLEKAGDVIKALRNERLAVGQLRSVPAGQYTASFLDQKGWLSSLRPHLAETSNVRLALALVARQEVPLGFVYASDVAAEPRVRSVFKPDPFDYPAIRYPMAVLAEAQTGADKVAQKITQSVDVFETIGFSKIPEDEADRCK